MGYTLVEKIATLHAVGDGSPVRSGDFVTVRPLHVMTHDNTGAVIPKFREIMKLAGRTDATAQRVADPKQMVFAIDHDIQNLSSENLGKYAKIASFAAEQGIDHYPAGTGIGHQVMIERGYVRPGRMVVASDSHSNIYGALACLGTPVVRTDAACLWATGTTWWQVPPVARLKLRGRLRPGVVGKDVIIALCGIFSRDEVLNHAIEFAEGPEGGLSAMSVEQRMSMANMTTEWGALAGVFPFDETLRSWMLARADESGAPYSRADVEHLWAQRDQFAADEDASYAAELTIDLSTIVPHVSGPNDVKVMRSLPDIQRERVKINKAWLMSCVNARFEDLVEAARVVKGRRVAPGVEFYLAAASSSVQSRATASGVWQTLLDFGAVELPPGCGTCIGLGKGTIKAGEVGISATNRNFEGRMGDRAGLVYLASPAVVAASACEGYICAPEHFEQIAPKSSIYRPVTESARRESISVIDGFPHRIKGRLVFLDKDNLNTDGIFAGKHTYNDALTREEMAKVVFENYDAKFTSIAAAGDVIVSGLNFGTGSSREQAATALKHFGIPCVIAASFSETYKRNAFNNGFVVFECSDLVSHLRSSGTCSGRTVVVGDLEIDYRRSIVIIGGKEFQFPPLSSVAQELVVRGGAERAVAARLGSAV